MITLESEFTLFSTVGTLVKTTAVAYIHKSRSGIHKSRSGILWKPLTASPLSLLHVAANCRRACAGVSVERLGSRPAVVVHSQRNEWLGEDC